MLRRERRYSERVTISVSPEMKASLQAASERYGIAAGVLGRWALEAGLPVVRDRVRKQQRKTEQSGGEAGQDGAK